MSDSFKIHIVDDDDSIRNALVDVLATVNLPAIGFASGKDFLDFVSDETSGCLLSDIRMPGMSGLQLQEELKKRGKSFPTIFMTAHADVPMAVQALQQGAVDFIEKPFREQELIDRIHKLVEQANAELERDKQLTDIRERLETLSPRERDVLEHIAEGRANKVIAAELNISLRTVENYRAKLLEKLNVRSTAGLIKVMVLASTIT